MTLVSDLPSNVDRKDRFYEKDRVSPCEIVYIKSAQIPGATNDCFLKNICSKKQVLPRICHFRIA